MKKKIIWIVVIGIVLIGLGIGAYALFHKSPVTAPQASSTTPTSTTQLAIAGVIQTKTDPNLGSYLADQNGDPLYTYNKDTSGISNCTGTCLIGWPVYTADSSSSNLPPNITIITRSDGTSQYAYKGLPLYTFTGDAIGGVNGNGVSDFAVAKP